MVMNQKNHWEDIDFSTFWQDVLPVTLAHCHLSNIPEVFRVSLSDLNRFSENMFPIECFDENSHELHTIATDAYSFPHLLELKDKSFDGPASTDGTGWIYVYSNVAEIALGKSEDGFFWWKQINYRCRVKIGCTRRHLFTRLKEQADKSATALARKPVILGAFWSTQAVKDERKIHHKLGGCRALHSGGVEWFECLPFSALETTRLVLQESRYAETPITEISSLHEAVVYQNHLL